MVALVVPQFSLASQVSTYQPRTTNELIAYLYGRIAQLLEIQRMIENGGTAPVTAPAFNFVSVHTRSASEVEANTAVLRGEVFLYGDVTASVWFEYGEDADFLDLRTRKVSVRSLYDRAVRAEVKSLEDEERYYFRIAAADSRGNVSYGDVYAFRTDEADE